MNKQKKLFIGEQPGLKLADDPTPISEEEAKYRTTEMIRCKNDIEYFVEHYYTIIDSRGERIVIKMYPKQRELLLKIKNNDRVTCTASRQSGKSETYSMFCVYQIIFQKNYNILIAGNKGEIAMQILSKIKDAYELIPNWMKPCIKIWNESKVKFDNGVSIKATTTQKNSARGGSYDLCILDEFSFVMPSIQTDFFTSSVPTISARKNSKLIVVSTPNGVGDKFHEIWKDATTNPDTIWTACRIDWWERPDRDEKWKERELQTLGSVEKFEQEYGNRFTVRSGDKLVTDDKILQLKENAEKSDAVMSTLSVNPDDSKNRNTFIQFFPYEKDHTYVMSLDCAEGTGQDASVSYILDITRTDDIRLSAKYASTKAIPEEFATTAYHLWLRYGRPKIMLESNACGMAVIEAFKNLSRNPNLKEPFDMFSIVNYNRPAGHTGIMSNNQSKSRSMLNLQNIIQSNHYKLILPDDDLYRELPFCEKRAGSGNVTYKALKGHHDDHILALNWGLFILSPELIEKHFAVKYAIDDDTKQKYPVLILPMDEDIDEYERAHKNSEDGDMSAQEAMELAAKWRMLGDNERASFILQMVYERETEDTGGSWGRNPYQIEQSLFSDSFRKKFFGGKYSDGYFRPPVSDPSDYWDDSGGAVCGWVM